MQKFFWKLITFVSVITVMQVGISMFVAPRVPFALGLPVIATLDRALRADADVLYFGDSVITSAAKSDTDRSSIAQILQKEVSSDILVADVSSPAYHPGIFDAMATYVARAKHSHMAFIIPINLRSFSPEWDMVPGHQFENEIFFLTHPVVMYFNKALAVFQAVVQPSVTHEQFEQTPVFRGEKQVGTVKEFIDERHNDDASAFLFYYMYHLDRSHRKIASLLHLVQTAVQNNITVYVYITPIDYQQGEKVHGKDFTDQVLSNAAVICQSLVEYHVRCLDLSTALSHDYFDYTGRPNEHMNYSGKVYVAKHVYDAFFKK